MTRPPSETDYEMLNKWEREEITDDEFLAYVRENIPSGPRERIMLMFGIMKGLARAHKEQRDS